MTTAFTVLKVRVSLDACSFHCIAPATGHRLVPCLPFISRISEMDILSFMFQFICTDCMSLTCYCSTSLVSWAAAPS